MMLKLYTGINILYWNVDHNILVRTDRNIQKTHCSNTLQQSSCYKINELKTTLHKNAGRTMESIHVSTAVQIYLTREVLNISRLQ